MFSYDAGPKKSLWQENSISKSGIVQGVEIIPSIKVHSNFFPKKGVVDVGGQHFPFFTDSCLQSISSISYKSW